MEIGFEDGSKRHFKLMTGMASTGFMLQPFIDNNANFVAAKLEGVFDLRHKSAHQFACSKKLVSISVTCERLKMFCARSAQVKFSEIHGLSLGKEKGDLSLRELGKAPYGMSGLISAEAFYPIGRAVEFGSVFSLIYPPAKLMFNKPKYAKEFSMYYTMMPESYTGGKKTDGVEVFLKFVDQKGSEKIIFSRKMNPLANYDDRGEQYLGVKLPVAAGRLILEISPGLERSWDRFIVRDLVVL